MTISTWLPVPVPYPFHINSEDLEGSSRGCYSWEQEWIPHVPHLERILLLTFPRSWSGSDNVLQLYRLVESILFVSFIYGYLFIVAIA